MIRSVRVRPLPQGAQQVTLYPSIEELTKDKSLSPDDFIGEIDFPSLRSSEEIIDRINLNPDNLTQVRDLLQL